MSQFAHCVSTSQVCLYGVSYHEALEAESREHCLLLNEPPCLQDTSFIGKRIYSFTWFFFTHQFMTISFYTVLVLHPLPGLPGQPRPHSSTSWVSCPSYTPPPPSSNPVPTQYTHRAAATVCAIAAAAAFVGLAAIITSLTAFKYCD